MVPTFWHINTPRAAVNKKCPAMFLSIILQDTYRFLQFFNCAMQESICNKRIFKISPHLEHVDILPVETPGTLLTQWPIVLCC